LVAQSPQPSVLPPSIRQGVQVATVPDYVRTMDEKAPAVVLDERIRERYGIMSNDRLFLPTRRWLWVIRT
jgi:hypothetical protein